MNSTSPLTGSHLRTYETIFRHPISHNLKWHDVHALFRHLGQLEEEPNGHLKVTRNGQILVLHPPNSKDVSEASEVMTLRHFLERFSSVHRRPVPAITPRALEMLTSYTWPGNVRQLENCIEQAVVLANEEIIDVDVLSLDHREPKKMVGHHEAAQAGLTLREVEQEHILRTLHAVNGNRTRAARLLGISLRCLQYKLKSYAQNESSTLESIGSTQIKYPRGVQS
jgi:hypothetical protein